MFSRTAVAVLSASSITSARSATARRCLFMLAVCSRESGGGGDQGCFFIGYRLLIAPANFSTSFCPASHSRCGPQPRRFNPAVFPVGFGKLLILAFRPISLRIRRRSQPNKSLGPPLIALSLKVQRDIAHSSSLRASIERDRRPRREQGKCQYQTSRKVLPQPPNPSLCHATPPLRSERVVLD
jgi:hypothetical protein